ncbi:aldehyde dehydrogenase [Hypoxylon sp. NC1633]|nr:aldehyde dehydrogenase [Hypoxylon sp. NC1633]
MTSELDSAAVDFNTFYNVIDGKLCSTAETRFSINPSTLEKNPDVPLSTPEDVEKAVQGARNAAESWAQTPWLDRKKAIEAFAGAIEAQADDFVRMLVKEQGKPLFAAKQEVGIASWFMRGICQLTIPEEVIEKTTERRVFTRHTPLGVVAAIVPWNFPMTLACMKIAPVLLTGNTVILKPSPFTPYCNLKMAEIGQRCFPPGVFQALSGDNNLGPWLTAHPDIDMVSFTGSVATGKKVMETCSKMLKRVVLELGGNDAAIVCADVDPSAIPTIAVMSFINAGQMCCCIKRLYVHEAIYDSFMATFLEVLEQFKTGDGFDEGVFVPPVANAPQFERVREVLAGIEEANIKLTAGSTKPWPGAGETTGYFFTPTVVENPPEDSSLMTEEQFGPILPIIRWSDEDDVIKRANNTRFGLGASVWTRDMEQGSRISKKLQAGTVWVNSHGELGYNYPFGGHKESGLGAEWGVDGLKACCNLQTIVSRSNPWSGF